MDQKCPQHQLCQTAPCPSYGGSKWLFWANIGQKWVLWAVIWRSRRCLTRLVLWTLLIHSSRPTTVEKIGQFQNKIFFHNPYALYIAYGQFHIYDYHSSELLNRKKRTPVPKIPEFGLFKKCYMNLPHQMVMI